MYTIYNLSLCLSLSYLSIDRPLSIFRIINSDVYPYLYLLGLSL